MRQRTRLSQDTRSTIAYDICAPGRRGVLCGRCSPGTTELLFSTECLDNSACDHRTSLLLALAVYGALYTVFFTFEYDVENFVDSLVTRVRRAAGGGVSNQAAASPAPSKVAVSETGYFQIFMYYVQTAALLKVTE